MEIEFLKEESVRTTCSHILFLKKFTDILLLGYGVLTCNHVVVYNGPKHQADFILNNGANYLDGQDWIEGQKKPLAGLHAVFGHFNCNGSEECHGTRKVVTKRVNRMASLEGKFYSEFWSANFFLECSQKVLKIV